MLDSALARPQQPHAYGSPPPDLADPAASLAFGLVRSHPFVDGNKRTAAVACELLVVPNGATLEADELELDPQYLDLASGTLSEAEFAAWLRPRLRLQSAGKLQETPARYVRWGAVCPGSGDRGAIRSWLLTC